MIRYKLSGTKWIWFWIVFSILMMNGSISRINTPYFQQVVDKKEKSGYFKASNTYFFENEVVIQFEEIIPLRIELANEQFYLLKSSSNIYFLKSNPSDIHLKEVLNGNQNELLVEYIPEVRKTSSRGNSRTYYYLNQDLKNDLVLQASNNGFYIESEKIDFYFSLNHQHRVTFSKYAFIIFLVITFILIWNLVLKYQKNSNSIRYLQSLNTEKVVKFSKMIQESTYHNSFLKLFIYRNELIFYRHVIGIISILKLEGIQLYLTKNNKYHLIFCLENKKKEFYFNKRSKNLEQLEIFLEEIRKINPKLKIDKFTCR